jgi:hypothetical protein
MKENNLGILKNIELPKEEIAQFNLLQPFRENFKTQVEFEKVYLYWTLAIIQKERIYISANQ